MTTTLNKTPSQLSSEAIDNQLIWLMRTPQVFVNRAMTELLQAEDKQEVLDQWGSKAAQILGAVSTIGAASNALRTALGVEAAVSSLPDGLFIPNEDGTVTYNEPTES